MPAIHHSAICVRDVDSSLRFWRDGLGFEVVMDAAFEGDWPTLLHAPSRDLRAIFLGDPENPATGIVELVDLGEVPAAEPEGPTREGFLLLSVMTDVEAALSRLAALGLGGDVRRADVYGVAMAVVTAADGTLVELVDTPAAANLDRLAEDGIDDVVILERDDGVGGTWRANTCPGAACDVPSHLYSLGFAPKPDWDRAYATQPEILAYIDDCYDRFDLRRKVRTGVTVESAHWCDDENLWRVRDTTGRTYDASVLVSAVGMFNTPRIPDMLGREDFTGVSFHSGRWDHAHNLEGRRVAVVGTGASAIQVVPAIADTAAHVDVYQRTAPWILPRKDEPYTDEQKWRFATDPAAALRHRQELHDLFEQTTAFLAGDPSVEAIAGIARDYLARKVAEPQLRATLTPDQAFGCQRTLISSDWYPTVQRDDVELVTTAIERITPTGIRTIDGVERDVDTIVWCTGFRAGDYLHGIEIVGRGGIELHDHWAGVPRAYHGMCVPGFPNFLMLYGPNTNQGGNSILLILEAQARFVASARSAAHAAGADTVDVTAAAMARHAAELERDLAATVWADGCSSYSHNADGDIVTQLPHTSGWYAEATGHVDVDDFTFASARHGEKGTACTTS